MRRSSSSSLTGAVSPRLLAGDTRARPSRFAANIEDVGALVQHCSAYLDRLVGRQRTAAVVKRIRRNVDHAHYEGALA